MKNLFIYFFFSIIMIIKKEKKHEHFYLFYVWNDNSMLVAEAFPKRVLRFYKINNYMKLRQNGIKWKS